MMFPEDAGRPQSVHKWRLSENWGHGYEPSRILFLSPFFAGLFVAVVDLGDLQRSVTIRAKRIVCIGNPPMVGSPLLVFLNRGSWTIRGIKGVQLLRAGEPANPFPFGVMIVTPKYAKPGRIGVPTTIALDDVANRLRAMEIPVRFRTPALFQKARRLWKERGSMNRMSIVEEGEVTTIRIARQTVRSVPLNRWAVEREKVGGQGLQLR